MGTFLGTETYNLYRYNTGASTEVKTYYGYDKDGEYVAGSKHTAKNADNDINLSKLNSAISDAETTFKTEFEGISKDVDALAKPTGDGLIVSGLSLKWTVEDLASDIKKANASSLEKLWTIYNQACQFHAKKQKEYNEEAKSKTQNVSGVVRVKEGG